MSQNNTEISKCINRQIKELAGIYRDAVRALDIPDSEFWIWYTIVSADGEYTQQDICSMWSFPKQTVNTVITRMRLKKLAHLEAIPGTRNRKVIRLTEAGRKYGEALVFPITAAEKIAADEIPAKDFELAQTVFVKYIDAVKRALLSHKPNNTDNH